MVSKLWLLKIVHSTSLGVSSSASQCSLVLVKVAWLLAVEKAPAVKSGDKFTVLPPALPERFC